MRRNSGAIFLIIAGILLIGVGIFGIPVSIIYGKSYLIEGVVASITIILSGILFFGFGEHLSLLQEIEEDKQLNNEILLTICQKIDNNNFDTNNE